MQLLTPTFSPFQPPPADNNCWRAWNLGDVLYPTSVVQRVSSRNSDRAISARRWVERSDTHQLPFAKVMGFAKAQPILRARMTAVSSLMALRADTPEIVTAVRHAGRHSVLTCRPALVRGDSVRRRSDFAGDRAGIVLLLTKAGAALGLRHRQAGERYDRESDAELSSWSSSQTFELGRPRRELPRNNNCKQRSTSRLA